MHLDIVRSIPIDPHIDPFFVGKVLYCFFYQHLNKSNIEGPLIIHGMNYQARAMVLAIEDVGAWLSVLYRTIILVDRKDTIRVMAAHPSAAEGPD